MLALIQGRQTQMGFRPDSTGARRDDIERAEGFFREAATLTGKMLAGLPSNRALLAHIKHHGLHRI